MRCDSCREAVSAHLDAEDPLLDMAEVDRHMAGCEACRSFAAASVALHRSTRVREAEPVPDLTAPILAAIALRAPARRGTRDGWLRCGLMIVGITIAVLAVPAMLPNGHGAIVHLSHELGSWDAAFGAALIFAAWQPERARGLTPMAAVLAVGLSVTAVLDMSSHHSTPSAESVHVLSLFGVMLLWLLARRFAPATTRAPSLAHA